MIPQLQIGLCALESAANHDHGFGFDGRAATQQMEQLNAISSIPFTQTDTTIESHEEGTEKTWMNCQRMRRARNKSIYNEKKNNRKKCDDKRWYHILVCRYSIRIRVWTGTKKYQAKTRHREEEQSHRKSPTDRNRLCAGIRWICTRSRHTAKNVVCIHLYTASFICLCMCAHRRVYLCKFFGEVTLLSAY